jgi:hypothetical protein
MRFYCLVHSCRLVGGCVPHDAVRRTGCVQHRQRARAAQRYNRSCTGAPVGLLASCVDADQWPHLDRCCRHLDASTMQHRLRACPQVCLGATFVGSTWRWRWVRVCALGESEAGWALAGYLRAEILKWPCLADVTSQLSLRLAKAGSWGSTFGMLPLSTRPPAAAWADPCGTLQVQRLGIC